MGAAEEGTSDEEAGLNAEESGAAVSSAGAAEEGNAGEEASAGAGIEEPVGPDAEEAAKAVSQLSEEPVFSAGAAEEGNAGEEARASAGIEEPKQKRQRRTKADVYGSGNVDVALKLQDLLPKVAAMKESMANLINAEQFFVAKAKKDEILACLQQIQNLPVCPCCFIELPSRACRGIGSESWRFRDRRVVCSHCGKRALYDGSTTHWQLVRESLRHRVRAECELALQAASPGCDGHGVVSKELKAILKDLNICYGHGRGPKNNHKEIIPAWVVGQINRTLQRLFFEPDLRKERGALLVALRLLGAR